MGLNSRSTPLTLIGPKGIRALITTVLSTQGGMPHFPLHFVEIGYGPPKRHSHAHWDRSEEKGEVEGSADENNARGLQNQHVASQFQSITVDLGTLLGGIQLSAVSLPHVAHLETWGYIISEPNRAGSLDARKAKALGVPTGKLLGELKAGRTVTLANGTVVTPEQVVGEQQPGKRVAIIQDTIGAWASCSSLKHLDLLIHECTYDASLERKAFDHGHVTSATVGRFASTVSPKVVAVTHFSTRYDYKANLQTREVSMEDVVQQVVDAWQAGSVNVGRVVEARDFLVLTCKSRDAGFAAEAELDTKKT